MAESIRDKVDLFKRRLKSFAGDFGLEVKFIEKMSMFDYSTICLDIDCYLPCSPDKFYEKYYFVITKYFEVDKALNNIFNIITAKMERLSVEEPPFVLDEDSMEVLDMLTEKYRRDRNDILLDALKWYAHVLTVAECVLVDEEE